MKATPEYKEEFLNRLDGSFIDAPVDGQGGFDKLLDVLYEIGFSVDYAQLHHDSAGKPDNYLSIGIDENIFSCSKETVMLAYEPKFIIAKEVLSWFEEDEELQVFEDKGQKFTIEGYIKEKCLEDLKESESFKKIDNQIIDWYKKEKENKMTYAEQQYLKIEELENTLKLQYPFSIDRNPTTGELFFRVVDTKALSKDEALKLANNIIKMFSPVESEE